MKLTIATLVGVLMLGLALDLPAPLDAQGAPSPQPGQVYEVVWSCLPQIGCYGELLRFDQAPTFGWVDVTSCGYDKQTGEMKCEERWRVNLGKAMAFRPHVARGRAAD